MNAYGDIESVNLRTGEMWRTFAGRRENLTTWRRDQSGTLGNMASDEFFFREGFKQGVEYARSNRQAIGEG